MITSELCAFTNGGLEVFRSWLDRAESNFPKRRTSERPPTEILLDEQYCRPVGFGGPLVQRRFQRKYDLGMEVCRALGRENAAKIVNMPNVWAWLSLFFYETTLPQDKEDRWFTGERSRHLVQTIQGRKQDQSHRHLVKSAVTNVLRFGEYAVVLMSEIGQSKIEEQVMSRRVDQPLAHHKEFIKTLYRLYWDMDADDLKTGARGEGPGSIMHMIDLLTQFDLTFDISHLRSNISCVYYRRILIGLAVKTVSLGLAGHQGDRGCNAFGGPRRPLDPLIGLAKLGINILLPRKQMRVADLFCGCGGLSSGFQAAGHDIVFAADKWSRARLTYDANFDHASSRLDLSDVVEAAHAVSQKSPEIIVGGPPCQDFSVAGLRTEAANADLTVAFAEVVRTCRPLWFVMENVPAAASSRAWAIARRRFGNAGYGLTELTLDASLYRVPQLRKRVFMIGRIDENDRFLDEDVQDAKADRALTVREYLGREFGVKFYYRHPRHWGRRAIYSIDEPAATVRSTNRPIPPKYTAHPLDAAPIDGVKPLNCFQRARLQTFLPDFAFDKSLAPVEIDMMVANAVPVHLAEVLADCILDYEVKREMSVEKDFRDWLREAQCYTDRSAGNVISRLKRVRRLIGPLMRFHETIDAVDALEKAPEFSRFSSSVKSQLRRAIYLHSEFSRPG